MFYDPNLPLILATDTSPLGSGSIVSQVDKEGERPGAFAKLYQAERNYSEIDKEVIGIVYGVNKFERYIMGQHFAIRTDHQPLKYIFNPNKELPAGISAKIS
ncbi:unnamed protein product [Lepeophtheirus salmonis]|uniref:(salmon louse) hypothetical protein n=1 Tax=Lepeophtheirus salmonis TaxID=72036 RepID=A0A7R8HEM0_LEPSM|nr:unnamed protein product [Lepeophtheirus salmonis]CAF3047362.1 unnamed protein product [Lepeophtheirus salmonis]